MRRTVSELSTDFKIAVLDDERGIIDSVSVVINRIGYAVKGFTNPLKFIESLHEEHYDLLILDYLMEEMRGDEVVEEVRKFNDDLYILLLTGHKDLAPPLETIKTLDIQGYCEKSDKFDQLILLIESGIKSISQVRKIKKFEDGLNKILAAIPKIYQLQPITTIMEEILSSVLPLVDSKNAFILYDENKSLDSKEKSIYKGIGKYDADIENFIGMIGPEMMECIGKVRQSAAYSIIENGAVFPLINEISHIIGVIYVEFETVFDELQLLDIYSRQAASSLSNAFLHELVNIKNEELNRTYEELRNRYIDTIQVLRLAVDAKDVYTRGHSDRVAYYAVKIGKAYDMPPEELENLRLAGIFHDVGKIGTADDILFKTEKLDSNEYNEVKKHTIKGANIMSAVSMF